MKKINHETRYVNSRFLPDTNPPTGPLTKLSIEALPNLGCATTRELLEEIKTRIDIDGNLDYRTIDSD